MCEICSKLTIKPAKRRHLLLILNIFRTFFLLFLLLIVNFEQVNVGWDKFTVMPFLLITKKCITLLIVHSQNLSKLYLGFKSPIRCIHFLANIYLFKINNINTRKRCQICSNLTIKTAERCHYVTDVVWYLYC